MVDRRYTVPEGQSAFPNRLNAIPPSRDGQVVIPLGRVNEIDGDKYMVFEGGNVKATSEPVVSAVFINRNNFVTDNSNPNDGFLKLGGVTTDIAFSGINGAPVVMMLEVKPMQKLDFIPDGVKLVGKDGTTSAAGKSYANESDKPETVILYFPQEAHGYIPRGANEPGDMVQLVRNVALTNASELAKIRVMARQKVQADISQQMLADSSMKKPERAELESRMAEVVDAELESRFEMAQQTVERMRELLGDVDASKDFSNPEKKRIEIEIKKFEKNQKDNEERQKKAQQKNKNASLDTNQTFESILEAGGFRLPLTSPATLAASASGLPGDVKGKLAKKESGMSLGAGKDTA